MYYYDAQLFSEEQRRKCCKDSIKCMIVINNGYQLPKNYIGNNTTPIGAAFKELYEDNEIRKTSEAEDYDVWHVRFES